MNSLAEIPPELTIATPHMVIIHQGQKYRCVAAEFSELEFQNTVNENRRLKFTSSEFNRQLAAGALVIKNRRSDKSTEFGIVSMPQSIVDLDPKELTEHQRIEKYVIACLELPSTRRVIRAKIKNVAKEVGDPAPPSPQKILRWRKDYRLNGNCVASASGRRRSGCRVSSKSQIVFEHTFKEGKKMIANKRNQTFPLGKKSIRAAVKAINLQLETHGEKVSAKFVKGMLEALFNQKDIERAKNGQAAARQRFSALADGQYGDFTNHRWQADHTIVDLRVQIEAAKPPFNNPFFLTIRLNLTVIIESRSGIVVGFYLGTRDPGQHTLQQALVMALLPKDELFASMELSGSPLPIYGKCEELAVDQDLGAAAQGFGAVLGAHGIKMTRLERRRPDLKGTVESLFNTANQQVFHTLDGAAVRHRDRSITLEQEQALHTIRGMNRILAAYFFTILPYEKIDHTSRTRLEIWKDGLTGANLNPVVDRDYLLANLLPKVAMSPMIGRHGVTLHHRNYDSEEFEAYRIETGCDGHRCAALYYVPDDLSSAYIKITPRSPLMLLRSKYMEQDEGLDVDAYIETRRTLTAAGKDNSDAAIFAALAQCTELITADLKTGKNIRRKKASRILGAGSQDVVGLMRIPEHPSKKVPGTRTAAHRVTPTPHAKDLNDVDEKDVEQACNAFDL